MSLDYENYLSPYTWRYGSEEMRWLWSETHKRRLWRQLWVALAEIEAGFGLARSEQVEALRQHVDDVDIERSLSIEAEIHHDLMAELKAFAEQVPLGGGILHMGATSMDIEDNADALRIRESLDLLLTRLDDLLELFAEKIEFYGQTALMGFTHLQPAEPSTLGYRLAGYAQDLITDRQNLQTARQNLRGKGFKGAVGSGASYAELLGTEHVADFEQRLSMKLGLPFFPIATQVYPRKQDYQVVSALAGMGSSLYKFAFDLRILQSPAFGEMSEPFGARQVGSSAMPFKRNPINAEKIDSLARLLAQMPRLAWDNAAHSLLERTLDDSANRRVLLPESFLAADELLRTSSHILKGLVVEEGAMRRNLAVYGPFAAVERVLMALVKAGADRQVMHELLRQHALYAWSRLQAGETNPLAERITTDPQLLNYLPAEVLLGLMDASQHLGDAPQRALTFARLIRETVRS